MGASHALPVCLDQGSPPGCLLATQCSLAPLQDALFWCYLNALLWVRQLKKIHFREQAGLAQLVKMCKLAQPVLAASLALRISLQISALVHINAVSFRACPDLCRGMFPWCFGGRHAAGRSSLPNVISPEFLLLDRLNSSQICITLETYC